MRFASKTSICGCPQLIPRRSCFQRKYPVSESDLIHVFDNGLVLIAEPMQWLESAAFSIVVPAGSALDPEDRLGLGNFTSEMVQRGCGRRDSHQFVEDLERLGVESNASVSVAHGSFGGAMPAENLCDALAIYADLLRRPHLPDDQLEEGRLVCYQEVRAIEDDLARKTMTLLRRRHYPEPWGRSCQGTFESLERITADDIRRFHGTAYRPGGTILSVAGKIDWPRLRDQVGDLLGDWTEQQSQTPQTAPAPNGYEHHPIDSSQTHVGVGYANVPYRHPDYYRARAAVGVLSDGMSSRLFTEVRENRGLCYTVYASCYSLKDFGAVLCYSGTSTDRAQETLDVMLAELRRLGEGIRPDELARLKSRIKSTLIMQQESSPSRSATMAADWYHLGRAQKIEEVGRVIDELTCEGVNAYLAEHPPENFTVVTLGAEPLEVSHGVS